MKLVKGLEMNCEEQLREQGLLGLEQEAEGRPRL